MKKLLRRRLHDFTTRTTCMALVIAFAGTTSAATPKNESVSTRTATMTPTPQPYRNEPYGFTLPSVPAAQAFQDKAPNPDHGVLLVLGDGRSIAVSAEFDAAGLGTPAAYLDLMTKSETGDEQGPRRHLRVAGHPALESTIRDAGSIRRIVAFRRGENGGINYAIRLETTPSMAARDGRVFDDVTRKLRLEPLPR